MDLSGVPNPDSLSRSSVMTGPARSVTTPTVMPQGTSALSPHILFTQYRGLLMYNMAEPPTPPAPPEPPAPPAPPAPPKPDDTEGRISALVADNKELKKQLKEFLDAKKKAEDGKLIEDGKLKELLDTKEKDLSTATTERDTLKEQLSGYEKAVKGHVKKSLEGIKDEKKRAAVEKLLEGRTPAAQMNLLPEAMELAGTTSTSFGGPTPQGGDPKTTKEQKEARFAELNLKMMKGEKLTPPEERDHQKLMLELSSYIPKAS